MMKNQKQADVMAPDSKFQALQTNEGHALLFSIGTDSVFYLIKETPTDPTGWVKTDLSSALSASYGGAAVAAKTFEVSQNGSTGNIDMALAITVNGTDYLYLALGIANTDASWGGPITWQNMPYDDTSQPFPVLSIADLYTAQATAGEYIVADVLKDPSSSIPIVFRFYIDPTKQLTGHYWNAHDLSANLEASTIQSCLGRKQGDLVDGIYTLGQLVGVEQLIYTPLYNAFKPSIPASPSRLTLPAGASAIATAPVGDGSTNLFVAANQALYFFPSNQQADGSTGQAIVSNALFAGVQSLFADTANATTIVWALNQAGAVFYLTCPAGQETNSSAWSVPVPIVQTVEQLTPYLNYQTNLSVLFAHLTGQNLVQLSQDPATAIWQQRNILLPSTDVGDVIEFDTFSTRIQATDDTNLPTGQPVVLSITATSPASIYVNNVYYRLSSDVATSITTDVTGVVTILQETHSLTAVCYQVTTDGLATPLSINPANNLVSTMAQVQSGSDLSSIQIGNADNNTLRPLVPANTPSDQTAAVASSLQQFVQVAQKMPADGSRIPPSQTQAKPMFTATALTASYNTVWGVSFGSDGWTYHEGAEAMQAFGLKANATTNTIAFQSAYSNLTDIGDAIKSTAEDIFNWLKTAYDDVTNFFIQLVDGVYHFFIELAGEVYQFVIDCVNAVVQAAEFVFNKIKVFFEDLVQWLGFIFDWDDILRTHNAIKNMLKQYVGYCVANIDTYKTKMADAFVSLENEINNWANLPAIPDSQTVSSMGSGNGSVAGQNNPQSHWGIYHMQNGVGTASSTFTPTGNFSADMLDDLLNLLQNEEGTFTTAYQNLKSMADNIQSMSPMAVLKQLVAIIADVVIDSAKNVVVALINIIESIIVGVLDALDAPIDIPVISWLYTKVSGNPLSILDLICLVVAIPTTIIYKIAKEESPFPDTPFTNQLISAPDFATIQNLYAAQQPQARMAVSTNGAVADTDNPLYDTLTQVFNTVAFPTSIVFALLIEAKANTPTSGLISVAYAVTYLPYIAPDLPPLIARPNNQKPWEIFNELVMFISVVKALPDIATFRKGETGFLASWDKASPWLDCVINLIWEAPVIWAVVEDHSTPGVMNFVGNTCFNAGGVIAPGSQVEDPKVKEVFVALMGLCALLYGIFMVLNLAESVPAETAAEV